ncbi:MAG: translation initiation factor IF-2 [Lachnospiraceae bacterium]|uniref:Translation initiation factor IF-2 n=1 Tax=Candidatus Weimeria bifida TaxID=2599074 RepID=A0A6N7IYF4_9FIRM|nr:translation initiation factor IF-2 [Candidatus Weimeria bifida]RRF96033.1 MAG: translation initiation factor IF-2 [Lachnospiraceae bacterium]
MAKKRIYDLAKELGVKSRDITDYFASKGQNLVPANNLEDAQVDEVKKHLLKKNAPTAEKSESKKPEANREAGTHKEEKARVAAKEPEKKPAVNSEKTAQQKKKKNITAVFHVENRNGNSRGGSRDRGRLKGDRQQRDRKPANRGPIKPRTGSAMARPKGLDTYPEETFVKKKPADEPKPQAAAKAETSQKAPVKDKKPAGPVKLGNIMDEIQEQKKRTAERKKEAAAERKERKERQQRRAENGNGRGDRNGTGRSFGDGSGRPSRGGGSSEPMVQENRSRHNGQNHHKKRTDHDALGKKQENLVSLEKKSYKKKPKNNSNKTEKRNPDEILSITIPDHITIRDLADKMKVSAADVIKKLFLAGKIYTLNSDVSFEEAESIAEEFNCLLEHEEKVDVIAELVKDDEDDPSTLVPRPPVVCVMGHVDHGKTSLLDKIRHTHVSDREAGGITQKIGAYVVNINGHKITFLDTPGHEAFTAMRMRGANSTDIAILVVAADDGVMPQTVEAINHAKAANVEIIVAVNKIDKPNANVERVKQELAEYDLIPEDWGGSTIFVPVSAHTGEGIDQLLEMVLLTADVMELKANPKRNARGICIESELDKGRGVVATVLVQKGTLHVGDFVAAGASSGKVRAMLDENGRHVKKAGPSTPVEILGLSEVPKPGEILKSFDTEKECRDYANTFVSVNKDKLVEDTRRGMSLDDLFNQIQAGKLKELDIIVKADVQGSVEAVKTSLEKLSNEEVVVKVIHGGVGSITESDVNLAAASNAIIIGFNVKPDNVAKEVADNEDVDIRLYKVIYNAISDVESAMKGMLEPIYEEQVIGHATVRQTFKSSEAGIIAGCVVDDGYIERDSTVRIRRGDDQIYEGKLVSLKRFKDDAKQVKAGYECGLVVEGFSDYQEDDKLEAYKMVEVQR